MPDMRESQDHARFGKTVQADGTFIYATNRKEPMTRLTLSALAIATILSAASFAASQAADKKEWKQPPEMKIDPNKQYFATLDTSKGKIVLELFPKESPKTVNSFVFLAREKFFDGTEFHRVIPGFMIQ